MGMYHNMVQSVPLKKYKNKFQNGILEKPIINNENKDKKENEQKIDENNGNTNTTIEPKTNEVKIEQSN